MVYSGGGTYKSSMILTPESISVCRGTYSNVCEARRENNERRMCMTPDCTSGDALDRACSTSCGRARGVAGDPIAAPARMFSRVEWSRLPSMDIPVNELSPVVRPGSFKGVERVPGAARLTVRGDARMSELADVAAVHSAMLEVSVVIETFSNDEDFVSR